LDEEGVVSMAEGLLRRLAGDRFEVYSAGTETTSVRPEAIKVVAEACPEACPVFPCAKSRLHWSFRDPSRATGSDEERLEVFRAVRAEILDSIERELVPENRDSLTR
jgi:arsenate reductase (thioredoxin)